MILPYLSIDLFFVAAPFIIRRGDDLRIYTRRVVCVILVAGICFLLFPLRYAFPRPSTPGWLGAIFDGFRALDAPHNLCPSLHAALLLLLGLTYASNLRGITRAVVLTWFGLIALSPLLTHQHHVVDIVGGILLAAVCSALIGGKFSLASRARKP